MPFVQRNQAGVVCGLYAALQPGYAEEFIADNSAEIIAYLRPPPAGDDVDAERDRRFTLGASVTVNGEAFTVDIDARGQRNLTGLAVAASLPGAGNFTFRDRANGMHTLSPAAMIAVAQQAFARVTAIYEASWTLKDAPSIPADFAANSHWPSP